MKRLLILTLAILSLLAFWVPSGVPASGAADWTARLLQPVAPHATNLMTAPTVTPGVPWAWGKNDSGQLGNDTTTDSAAPVPVTGLPRGLGIAAGLDFSLALHPDGTVRAWGKNNYGQLGNGSAYNVSTPVQVSEVTGATAIAAGGYHSLALRSDGTVRAWGVNNSGQLGFGSTYWRSTVPVQVAGLTGVVAIAAGGEFSLALRSDGTVWAWGRNNFLQLGANIPNSISPVQVRGLTEVVAVAAGSANGLALRSDGAVWAWGANDHGELGGGATSGISSVPVKVSSLTQVVAIAAGLDHCLALRSDGAVWAWGRNDAGQLGNGTTSGTSRVPVKVSGLTPVVAVAAGGLHSLALATEATMSATPTATPTYGPTSTPSATWTPTAAPTPTLTPTPSPRPTFTPTPTSSPTPLPSPTPMPSPTPTPTTYRTPTASIALSKGWNLISIPRSLANPLIASILADFADMVYYFDAATNGWQHAALSGGAWTGNLQTIEEGKGYWVNATRDATIVLGIAADGPPSPGATHALPAGWSMIGYTSGALIPSRPLSEYLASLGDKWVSIYRYDPSKGWEIAKHGGPGFTEVGWGRGYWVNLTEPGTLVPQNLQPTSW